MPSGASVQRPPQSQPQPAPTDPVSNKRDLASWWKQFKKNTRRDDEKVEAAPLPPAGIFGVPLSTSIRYANVAISLLDVNGESFTYGYVPIVVAKCGVYLKEKATHVAGIFRVAGAERRIKELQAVFNSPERYGKGLDWTGYTVHDAANILRRYLNQLPEPIIPLEFYERFRKPLRNHQAQAVGEMELQQEISGDFDPEETIKTYQQLITELPPLNRQLLLYILDLLAVFASKSEANLMPAPNLSAIFQPGLLSHPSHDMAPAEYRLSQDVLIFLIEHQDNFLVGMQGTAADEKTIQDVQSGGQSPGKSPGTPTTPKGRTQQLLGRSSSTASAGSESVRRHGGVRRNVSVNSKHSRQSNNAPSPVEMPPSSPMTPSGKNGGVHRSNTVPSKKSPALPASERFQNTRGSESPGIGMVGTPVVTSPLASGPETPALTDDSVTTPSKPQTSTSQRPPGFTPPSGRTGRSLTPTPERDDSNTGGIVADVPITGGPGSPTGTTPRERSGFSSFFRTSASTEREKAEGRRPNKLQKRRPQDGALPVSNSQASLSGGSYPPSPGVQPFQVPGQAPQANLESIHDEGNLKPQTATSQADSFRTAHGGNPSLITGEATHPVENDSSENSLKPDTTTTSTALRDMPERASGVTLKPGPSPSGSIISRPSLNNDMAAVEDEDSEANAETKESWHHRWKLSMSTRKPDQKPEYDTNLTAEGVGGSASAQRSTSTVGSVSKQRKSFTDDSNRSGSVGQPLSGSDNEAWGEKSGEKRGLSGWFKGKLQERKDREAEKERAKSPPPAGNAEQSTSKQSLGAVAEVESDPQVSTETSSSPQVVEASITTATAQDAAAPVEATEHPVAEGS